MQNMKGRDHLKKLDTDGKIIYKHILKKQSVKAETGLDWSRIGSNLKAPWSCLVLIPYTWCHQKVPGLGQKRNVGLTCSILAAISFKIVSLGPYTTIPSFLSVLQKHCGSHFP
jgi:hypothetical protein